MRGKVAEPRMKGGVILVLRVEVQIAGQTIRKSVFESEIGTKKTREKRRIDEKRNREEANTVVRSLEKQLSHWRSRQCPRDLRERSRTKRRRFSSRL